MSGTIDWLQRAAVHLSRLRALVLAMMLLGVGAPLHAQDQQATDSATASEPAASEAGANDADEPVLVPATTPMVPKEEDEDEEPPEQVEDFDPTEEVNADVTLDFPVDV